MADVNAKELGEAMSDIDRVVATLQRLSESSDALMKLVFGTATQRTLMELCAMRGRFEYVLKTRKPSASPPADPAKK